MRGLLKLERSAINPNKNSNKPVIRLLFGIHPPILDPALTGCLNTYSARINLSFHSGDAAVTGILPHSRDHP